VPNATTLPPRQVLGSKLQAPAAPQDQVWREQTLDFLAATGHVRLVLLRAPAGFGKSTVMLQLRARLEAEGVATAWLTLDRADNDTSRFLAGLNAAAATVLGDADASASMVAGGGGFVGGLGDTALDVVGRLAAHDRPFALFLDDFEAITEPAVLALVREVLDHLPRNAQIVIGSRSLPDLRLARLRARAQLLEVDAERLRFTLEETHAYFGTRSRRPLDEAALMQLHRKTEGWIAALWLASAALNRSEVPADFIARLSGNNQAIADYLAEEVLARQTPAARQFLLYTSVLKQLDVGLCNALLPDTDSAVLLREIEHCGVLVVPLGEDRSSFRYHSLFARFLRAQLQREAPQAVAALHSAAADWYEAQCRPVPAIDHALEAGDNARSLDLLSRHAPRLLAEGRLRLLARWFSKLTADALDSHPQLQVLQLWAVCFVRGPWEAMDLLQGSTLEASADPKIAPHVRAIKPLILAMMDRYEDAYRLDPDFLKHLPSGEPFADAALTNVMATVATVMGEQGLARRLIDWARRGQGASASAFNQMYSETAEGIIDLQEGRLRQAMARFRMAVGSTHSGNYSHGNAWAGVAYAAAAYETGDIDLAARLLQLYLPLVRDVGLADPVMLGGVIGSRIAFHRGDVDDAFQQLAELEYLGHHRRLPRLVCGAQLERARLLMLQGHHQAALQEIDRADDPAVWQQVDRLRYLANDLGYLALFRWRWMINAGDAPTAADQLGFGVRAAVTAGRYRRALKLGVLHALALHRSGRAQLALPVLHDVLKSACAEGYWALLVDEGPIAAPLLHELQQQLASSGAAQKDPILADYVSRLCRALGPQAPDPDNPSAMPPALLLEPLTRKEVHVLQLLAEGYSNGSMAEKLFVSDSTVRTHLRNINTKLDVHNRMQAVSAARRLGVIR